ncbi:hypothetical protein CW735_10500 [Alteromonas sp. MB-3u-76]|uniref:hypothetical protein n=1 Tax=Alteromonas sp. MB-3u-76 TaxID=2058133 RepID=UPI000C316139|nr:hypothetical protein [Alteromonas sp. MB-3u-76]AUC88561.1 hypothetical protein CW735_10500 [Alteromonas sp. MB-3u-76]
MIVGDEFQNDNNGALKNIQEKLYGQSVSVIFQVAREQYITADSILEAKHPYIPLLIKMEFFDHRVLQSAHDTIAAAFRYKNQNIKQLDLFENVKEESNEYIKFWNDWLYDELCVLKGNAIFVRNVVEAVIHSSNERGYAAEERLHEFLVDYYSTEELSNNVSCKVSPQR